MKKLLIKISTLLSIILIAILIFAITITIDNNDVNAADSLTITVNKTPTVSVYVTGMNVELVSSDSFQDIYNVEGSYTLRAVNETKIFESFSITDSSSNVTTITENPYTNTITENISVAVTRRDTLLADYGSYINDRYIIDTEDDLVALQTIINTGPIANNTNATTINSVDDAYANFYEEMLELTTVEAKRNYIVNNGLFAKMQKGYYVVMNNISLFNDSFVGIGTSTNPFNGVMCGNVDGRESKIVYVINDSHEENYGLFGYLGENAVIRNIKVSASLGITASSPVNVGGLAGYAKGGLLLNTYVSAMVNIKQEANEDVYVGAIFGQTNGFSVDSITNISNESHTSVITVSSIGNIYAGYLAGRAKDLYIKEIDFELSGFSISAVSNNNNDNTYTNIYAGSLVGYNDVTSTSVIENVTISSSNAPKIVGKINRGNCYVGGLIGYTNATNNNLTLGKIALINRSFDDYEISSNSLYSTSRANCYTGGLIAYINGNNVSGNEEFKNRISTYTVDDKQYKEYNAIFKGNFDIESLQNGLTVITYGNATYGKTIAAGLVGYGYLNINGTNDNPSDIVLSREGNFKVASTHTSITNMSGSGNSKEHCTSSLVFGMISTDDNALNSFKYINVYGENLTSTTTRDTAAKSYGDIHNAGFIGYAINNSATILDHVNCYYNSSSIINNSLSYSAKYTSEGNNAFVGGLAGRLDSQKGTIVVSNCSFQGYDFENDKVIGTNSVINSIQNTQPGGNNYMGENYVGGIVSVLYRASIEYATYNGSESNEDYIRFIGHQNPDSAFGGGIVALIKTVGSDTAADTITIDNCHVYNADVSGEATEDKVSTVGNPDIYVGGIFAAYYSNNNTTLKMNVTNCSVINTSVRALGYIDCTAYAGGIAAGLTWQGNNVTFSNNLVKDCTIRESSDNSKFTSLSGGIVGYLQTAVVIFTNNAVVDTNVISDSTKGHSAGICSDESGSTTYENNFSNATVTAMSAHSYGICSHGTVNSTNYYNSDNVNSYDATIGTGISFKTPYQFTSASTQKIFNIDITADTDYVDYVLDYGTEATGFTLGPNNNNGNNNNGNSVTLNATDKAYTDRLNLWINYKGTGTSVDTSKTEDELIKKGWFNMGTKEVYYSTGNNVISLSNQQVTYVDGTDEYKFVNNVFKNQAYPYNEKSNIGYTETENGKNITIKVFDEIPVFKLTFDIPSTNALLVDFFNASDVQIDMSTNQVNDYGTYEITYQDRDGKKYYTLLFYPNINIDNNATFKIKFKSAGSDAYSNDVYTINLVSNELVLHGVKYAEYTPVLNYHEFPGTHDYIEGEYRGIIPYYIPVETVIKFVPVFTKTNDIEDKLYDQEKYIEYVNYSVTGGTILSSGEFSIASVNFDPELKLTYGTKTIEVPLKIADYKTVTYSITGGTIETIPYASNETDFVYEVHVYDGYCGTPNVNTITIGGKTYDSNQEWSDNESFYTITIPKASITGNISITLEFPLVYEVTFNLDCDLFNPSAPVKQKVFLVKEGEKLSDIFLTADGTGKTNLNHLDEWIEDNTIFGYAFTGFYLVDYSVTDIAYGISFDELLDKNPNLTLSSSLTFYARWTFLIELVEAPGTHIVPSFNSDFMIELDPIMNNNEYEDLLHGVISVPCNNKDGYTFTVEKDADFVGEASLKAYVITGTKENHIVTEIAVEKYHDNMYLYFIAPEQIDGYLVLVTSVSNSGVIAGENTSSVTEEIIPEDGVYTFKYIVNHKKTATNNSYIYDSGISDDPGSNLKLNKEFVLRFKEQHYENGELSFVERNLAPGTIVQVYYQKIVNDVISKELVGLYNVGDATNISSIYLSSFRNINNSSTCFPVETFAQCLGNNENVSEVYYFVVTPPNGLKNKVLNEMQHYIIEGGYYDSTTSDYVKGVRTEFNFVNKPLDQSQVEEIQNINKETSCQSKLYTIIPSRVTHLEKGTSSSSEYNYIFTDDTTYHLFEIETQGAEVKDNKLVLHDDAINNTIIKSTELPYNIESMIIKLGYGTGLIQVSGSTDGVNYNPIGTINVTDPSYNDYKIIFPEDYNYFMIDNIALTDIRISEITLKAKSNGMTYKVTDFTIDANNKINVSNFIENDVRHDGKAFVLSVQLKKKDGDIVEDIPTTLTVQINGETLTPSHSQSDGIVTAFFNLSSKMGTNTSVNVKIIIPSGYSLHAVQLVEAENTSKPATGEVRETILP